MSETKTAVGVRESVEIKNDWHSFNINTGGTYPLKLSTKKQSLIAHAMSLRPDELVEWVYIEKESDRINEKSGKPYVNRWLEEVHAATSSEREGLAPKDGSHPDGAGTSRSEDVRGESIERQAIIKAALPAHVENLKFASHEEFFRFLDECAAWVRNEKPTPEQVQAQAPAGSTSVDMDDVPF